MADREKLLAALREVTILLIEVRDANPDLEFPSTFDPSRGSDALGRARTILMQEGAWE